MIRRILFHRIERKCYASIDTLPVYYWNKIHETENLSFLFREDVFSLHRRKPNKLTSVALAYLWRQILNEYIEAFGFDKQIIRQFRIEKEIALLKCEMILNKNKKLLTEIEIKKKELENVKKFTGEKSNLFQTILALNKFGYNINEFTTSVRKFYTAAKEAEAQIKKMQANGGGN